MSHLDPTEHTSGLSSLAEMELRACQAEARAETAERERDVALGRQQRAQDSVRRQQVHIEHLQRRMTEHGAEIQGLEHQGETVKYRQMRDDWKHRAEIAEARLDGARQARDALMTDLTEHERQKATGELVELHERGTYDGDQQCERITDVLRNTIGRSSIADELYEKAAVAAIEALRNESEPHPDWVDYVEGRNGAIYAGDED